MKNIIKCILILMVNSCYSMNSSSTPKQSAKVDSIETIVKKTIRSFMQQHQIPGAAMALYINDTPHLFHFGYAHKEKKIPVTENTIFEIGSISKVFTNILLAHEILDGRMKLTDPIYNHIPMLATNKKLHNTTLEKLCTHTSTLTYNAPDHVKTQKDLLQYINTWKPSLKNEVWWQYSNHGIELLRIALEETTQQTIYDLLSKKILQPLHMNSSSMNITDSYKEYYAQGYDKQGNKSPHWNHPFLLGTAALRANNSDMLNFLKASIGLPDTPAHLKKAIQLTQTAIIDKGTIKQGMAWDMWNIDALKHPNMYEGFKVQRIPHAQQIFDGDMLIGKTGTTAGFHAYIAVIPNQKVGIVIMINRMLWSGFAKMRNLGKEILLKTAHIEKHKDKTILSS